MSEQEEEIQEETLTYKATEVASLFHHDNSFVRLLFGPVGCGKSVAGCLEILGRAMRQEPGHDGVRRSRWAVIRNTFPDLKSTTIATWKTWFPEAKFGNIRWDSPIKHHINFMGEDGYVVDLEVLFIALDSDEDVRKLRSLELTGVYLNELQYLNYQIFLVCTERVNRYPPKILGAPITWTGVIADTNPPDTNHWIYKEIDKPQPKGYRIFKYKPAVIKLKDEHPPEGVRCETSKDGTRYITNPDADYVKVQNSPEYWVNQIPSRTDEQIKVTIIGDYGIIVTGKPVHTSYNDRLHYSSRILMPSDKIELGLGWDFGLTPACAIMQMTPRGQLQIIDEIWTHRLPLRQFTRDAVIPHLDKHYPWWRDNYFSWHDPAGSTGSQTDGKSCEDILLELGIKSLPAATNNDPTPRRDGLDYFLSKMVDGEPGLVVSQKCEMIRTGLMGGFQYAKVKVGGEDRYHEKPLKNIYSHICEGLEYGAMNYAPKNRQPTYEAKPYRIKRGNFMTL